MATDAATLSLREIGRNGLGAPVLLVMMLAMIIIPLPPIALDMFFTFNITLSLVVLMVPSMPCARWISVFSRRCCW